MKVTIVVAFSTLLSICFCRSPSADVIPKENLQIENFVTATDAKILISSYSEVVNPSSSSESSEPPCIELPNTSSSADLSAKPLCSPGSSTQVTFPTEISNPTFTTDGGTETSTYAATQTSTTGSAAGISIQNVVFFMASLFVLFTNEYTFSIE